MFCKEVYYYVSLPLLNTFVFDGSFLEVNGGALEICREFLGENAIHYSPFLVQQLINAIITFLQKCEHALKVNKSMIDASQTNLQQQLESSFANLQSEIGKYLAVAAQIVDISTSENSRSRSSSIETM